MEWFGFVISRRKRPKKRPTANERQLLATIDHLGAEIDRLTEVIRNTEENRDSRLRMLQQQLDKEELEHQETTSKLAIARVEIKELQAVVARNLERVKQETGLFGGAPQPLPFPVNPSIIQSSDYESESA